MIDKQKLDEVLKFIMDYTDEYGYAPSIRDICAELNIKSTATVYSYIAKLQERGDLVKASNKKRAVTINNSSSRRIPLIGKVTAGYPIFAVENYQGYYNLPGNEFKGDDLFMLEVSGDSMINAGIFGGDKIIVRKQSYAENGEIVVALIEDSATVKRFYKTDTNIILHPENDTYPDFVYDSADHVEILGKVIGLLRSFNH